MVRQQSWQCTNMPETILHKVRRAVRHPKLIIVYVDKMLMHVYQFLFVRRRLYWFNRNLYRYALRGIGVWNVNNDKTSGEKYFLKEVVGRHAKMVQRPFVVLDVGANVGDYSQRVRQLIANSTVYAFEPNPITFESLKLTAKEYGFSAVNCGCGEETGKMILYDHLGTEGTVHASLFRDVIEGLYHTPAVEHEVQIVKLDSFVLEHGIERVHFLKIDTEGNEMAVLKGLEETIRAGKVDFIQFEFNEMNIVSRTFFIDFYNYLSDYNLHRLLPDGMVSLRQYSTDICEVFGFQNIAALRKDMSFGNDTDA